MMINFDDDHVIFSGIINYKVQYGGSLSSGETLNCTITVLNNENVREKFTVITNDEEGLSGIIKIENAKLWWPYLMHEEPGYMYTLEVFTLIYGKISVYIILYNIYLPCIREKEQ